MTQQAGIGLNLFGGMLQAGGSMMDAITRGIGAGLFAANAGNIGEEIHRLGNTFGDSTAALTNQVRGYLNEATNRLDTLRSQYGTNYGWNLLNNNPTWATPRLDYSQNDPTTYKSQEDAALGYLHDMRVQQGAALGDIQNFAGQQLAGDVAQQQEALDVNRDELLSAQYGGQLTSAQRIALQQQAQFASERNLGNRSQQLSAITQQMRNETRQAYTGAIADAHRTLIAAIGGDREFTRSTNQWNRLFARDTDQWERTFAMQSAQLDREYVLALQQSDRAFALGIEQLDASVRNAYTTQIAQLDNAALNYYSMGPTYNYQALTQLTALISGLNPGDPYRVAGQQFQDTGQALVAMAQQRAASDSGGMF